MTEKFMGIEIEAEDNYEEKALAESRRMKAISKLFDLYAQAVHEMGLPEESLIAPSLDDKIEVIKKYLNK